MSSLRELWFTGRRAVEVRQGSPAVLEEGQVRVRALASGISQGTELLLFGGEGPTEFDPSLDAPGAPTYPRRYGYAWVGQVAESRAPAWSPSARVFGLLAHGDEHCVPASALRALPASVPAERAVLAANLETAINVVWDGGVALGDDVLVIGGGVVGLLCGFVAQLSGAATVRLLEPAPRRREAALKIGFDVAVAPSDGALLAQADVVIEASGRPECLSLAIPRARPEGVVVVASFYGQRVAPLQLGDDFHRRRLTLRSSQVSHLPPHKSARWSYARRFELVSRLLADARLDILLEPPVAFDEAPALYGRLAQSSAEVLQCSFHYR